MVDGVTCYLSRAKTGGIKVAWGWRRIARRPPSPVAIGPIRIRASSRMAMWCSASARRWCSRPCRWCFFDESRNALVYLVYSDRVIEGSPQNAVTAIPILPWPVTQ